MTSTAAAPNTTATGSLEQAAVAYATAKRGLDAHDGPKQGAEFDALMRAWRTALLNLDAASMQFAKESEIA